MVTAAVEMNGAITQHADGETTKEGTNKNNGPKILNNT